MPTLNWIGKEAVVNHDQHVPYRLVHCDGDRSVGEAGAGNLLVEGDNLHALKALLPYYRKRVKCIYIDPPYNTGKQTWAYSDNVDSPIIQQWLRDAFAGHQIDENDLSRHDKWLCMMYPRLQLLKQFLRDDGIIWVSIDDTELAYLTWLMDEIFSSANRIGTLVWKNATDNNPTRIAVEHEYILCYAKDKNSVGTVWKLRDTIVKRRMLDKYAELKRKYFNDIEQIQKEFRSFVRRHSDELQPLTHYNRIDEYGPYTGSRKVHNPGKEGYHYDVIHPVTGRPCVEPARGYRCPETTLRRLQAEGKILYNKDHTQIIQIKEYLDDFEGSLKSVIDLDGRTGANALESIFGNRTTFRNPKSVEIIQSLLSFTTKDDDLILDSFAGSGTTGHAVLQLNKEDGGNRRFILIEMEPDICRNITAERLRRVIEEQTPPPAPPRSGEGSDAAPPSLAGKGDGGLDLGGGFRYCRLGEPLFDERGQIRGKVKFGDLAHHIFFAETGEPLPRSVSGRAPFIGELNGTAYYLLWHGSGSTSVLDSAALKRLDRRNGPRVVYADGCRLSPAQLQTRNIVFKQIPYEVKAG